MIDFHGLATVPGYSREAVFAALSVKGNWPSVAGVRLGPEAEVLEEGGCVRAVLELPGATLAVTGSVTVFEPPSRIEAAGRQAGICAAMTVTMTDNAQRAAHGLPLECTVSWRFKARLPIWLAVLELPSKAAIKAAIPIIEARFVGNILRYLHARATEPRQSDQATGTKNAKY